MLVQVPCKFIKRLLPIIPSSFLQNHLITLHFWQKEITLNLTQATFLKQMIFENSNHSLDIVNGQSLLIFLIFYQLWCFYDVSELYSKRVSSTSKTYYWISQQGALWYYSSPYDYQTIWMFLKTASIGTLVFMLMQRNFFLMIHPYQKVTSCHSNLPKCNHNLINSQSVTGVIHFVNWMLIDWNSKKQGMVETSIFRSDFILARTATEQVLDLCIPLCYIGVPIENSLLLGDNKSGVTNSAIPYSVSYDVVLPSCLWSSIWLPRSSICTRSWCQ